jgi:pimeloyl-ACP methyl ester carboxylesterase
MTRSPPRASDIPVDGGSLHVIEAGPRTAPPVVLLHGWPQSASAWAPMMATGSAGARLIAVDLPGTGGSAGVSTDGTKTAVAGVIHQLIQVMGLTGVTLAGQDIGGMVVFAYLRRFGGLAKAAIMDVVIPGLDPWDEVLRNPYLWHFAFHGIPNLPELLVEGRERRYFDYFFDQLATHPAAITDAARNQYAAAYRAPGALSAGFDWYRAFPRDAQENLRPHSPISTPVLCVRGDGERGDVHAYASGLRASGLVNVSTAVIADAGHFTQEEQPERTWTAIAAFALGG